MPTCSPRSSRSSGQASTLSLPSIVAARQKPVRKIDADLAFRALSDRTRLRILHLLLHDELSVGDISGAHLNPAVTAGFWASGRFLSSEVAPYLLSQFAGALGASGLLKLLFPENKLLGVTLPAGSELQSFILETVLTFLLILTILNVSTGAREKGITAGIGNLKHFWLYVPGPVLRALLAVPACCAIPRDRLLLRPKVKPVIPTTH
jgi:DNA-binding transcriptional ArsR family regulator